MIVVSTSSQEAPLLEVPLKVRELAPVRIEPAAVVLRGQTDGTISGAMVQISTDTPAPIEIVDIEKPDWLDVYAEPNDGSLPTKSFLTANGSFDNINSVVDARVGLILGRERRKVEIALLFLPSVRSGVSQD